MALKRQWPEVRRCEASPLFPLPWHPAMSSDTQIVSTEETTSKEMVDTSAGFVSQILTPGSSLHPTFLLILDGAFATLLCVFLALLFLTRGSVHIMVLIGIEGCLWASIKWCVVCWSDGVLDAEHAEGSSPSSRGLSPLRNRRPKRKRKLNERISWYKHHTACDQIQCILHSTSQAHSSSVIAVHAQSSRTTSSSFSRFLAPKQTLPTSHKRMR